MKKQEKYGNAHLQRIPTGINTIFFIPFNKIPSDCQATHGKILYEYKPHKCEKHGSRLTVGGDRIDYPFPVATPTEDITVFKCLVNSVLSTHNAKFMTADTNNFYLNTPMERYEYTKLHIEVVPGKIIQQYNLQPLVHNDDHIYIDT